MAHANCLHSNNEDGVNESSLNDIILHGWQNGPEGIVVFARLRDLQLDIHVETDNFHRSPMALKDLQQNQARFGSDHFEPELHDYLETVISYFVSSIEKLVPLFRHVGKLTLAHLRLRHRHRSRLEFHDEVPCASSIVEDEDEEAGEGCGQHSPPSSNNGQLDEPNDYRHAEQAFAVWPFPRFKLSEVEVPCDNPATVFATKPDRVFVNSHPLF